MHIEIYMSIIIYLFSSFIRHLFIWSIIYMYIFISSHMLYILYITTFSKKTGASIKPSIYKGFSYATMTPEVLN